MHPELDQSETEGAKVKSATRRAQNALSRHALRSVRFATAAVILTRAATNHKRALDSMFARHGISIPDISFAANEIYRERIAGVDMCRESALIAQMLVQVSQRGVPGPRDDFPTLTLEDVIDAAQMARGMSDAAADQERLVEMKAYAKREAADFCDLLARAFKPEPVEMASAAA